MSKIAALVFTLCILSIAQPAWSKKMLDKKAPAPKGPVAHKPTAGSAKATPKVQAKKATTPKKVVKKAAVPAKKPAAPVKKAGAPAKKPAAPAKKPVKKAQKKVVKKKAVKKSAKKPAKKGSIKKEVKHQEKRVKHRVKAAKHVEKMPKAQKPKKDREILEKKDLKPHPKKNLKLALKGVSKDGMVSNHLDYSKLVVDSLNHYHQLKKAMKKKDAKKVKKIEKWVKKNTHMSKGSFLKNFKAGAKKIKMEVLTNGAAKSKSGKVPKELRKKLDKSELDSELHKFTVGQAKGRHIPKKIQNTLKKIKGGKVTETKVGNIKGYNYLFVYVHQPAMIKK